MDRLTSFLFLLPIAYPAEGYLVVFLHLMHLTQKAGGLGKPSMKDHLRHSSPSKSVLLEGGSGGFNFLKMPVLMEVGGDTPRENTPTTGLSGSSKLNFLGLYARSVRRGS